MNPPERTKRLVTLEDNVLSGGMGEAISEFFMQSGVDMICRNFAWPTEFIEHGSQEKLFEKYRLDGHGIAERIRETVEG